MKKKKLTERNLEKRNKMPDYELTEEEQEQNLFFRDTLAAILSDYLKKQSPKELKIDIKIQLEE